MFHLAVHAIANETRPDRAALVLLSDPINGEDGFLQTSEVVQLPLNADLVVLSACDTAVGPVQGEEGVETLSRAFLLAGARTVVSTLWSIDDDTTLYLMKSFYAQLARKKPVPYALRVAKKEYVEHLRTDQSTALLLGRIHGRGGCPATERRVNTMLDSTARLKIISRIETLVLKHHFNVGNVDLKEWCKEVDEQTPESSGSRKRQRF